MNWRLGLQRISAVFWGLCAVFVGGILIWIMFEGDNSLRAFVYLALCLGTIYLLYRLTNWIIGGFFAK